MFEEGAVLILLDVPTRTEFGIDLNSWNTGIDLNSWNTGIDLNS